MKAELTKLTELRTAEFNSENFVNSVFRGFGRWLPDVDLNHDKQIQSLLCYRYTIGQMGQLS
jgi:hypothetical protein